MKGIKVLIVYASVGDWRIQRVCEKVELGGKCIRATTVLCDYSSVWKSEKPSTILIDGETFLATYVAISATYIQ